MKAHYPPAAELLPMEYSHCVQDKCPARKHCFRSKPPRRADVMVSMIRGEPGKDGRCGDFVGWVRGT